MLNARGNVFSQKHMRLNASDPRFWNFSFHEIGMYDIPATIDYILERTNQTKLAYVGVSQGVTVLLVTLSELPEYNDKISIANMMAPAVIFKHLSSTQALIPRSIELINLIEVSYCVPYHRLMNFHFLYSVQNKMLTFISLL